MRRCGPLQAEAIAVSIIRWGLIVLVVREVENGSTRARRAVVCLLRSAECSDPGAINFIGPRELVDVRTNIRNDPKQGRWRTCSISARLRNFLSSSAAWPNTRPCPRESTAGKTPQADSLELLTYINANTPTSQGLESYHQLRMLDRERATTYNALQHFCW